jgi:hypothetical protein
VSETTKPYFSKRKSTKLQKKHLKFNSYVFNPLSLRTTGKYALEEMTASLIDGRYEAGSYFGSSSISKALVNAAMALQSSMYARCLPIHEYGYTKEQNRPSSQPVLVLPQATSLG